MKKLFSAFVLAMALFTGASAQKSKSEFFIQGGLPTMTGTTVNTPTSVSVDIDFYGFGVGMNTYQPFSQKTPLYFMAGLNFKYGHSKTDAPILASSYLQLRLPLGLMYSAEICKGVSIEPYAGFNLSYFLMGNTRVGGYGYRNTQSSESWFPEAKRFNKGYQFGLNVEITQLVLGVEYEHDLSVFGTGEIENAKVDYKWHSVTFKLGFRF